MLVLDIGNTSCKWGLLHGRRVVSQGRLVHVGADLRALARDAWHGLERPQRVLIANVAGSAVAEALGAWMQETWDVAPEHVVPQRERWGVTNAYVEPERLGVDRWAALVAVRNRLPVAACIVDCGTAITIDALSADGEHLGGLIVPGLTMMRRALIENTGSIPNEGEGAVALLARSTRDAVTGGTLYAAVALIDRVTSDVAAELGGSMARVITGGDAPRIVPLLAGSYRYEPDLVLQGLAVMAEG
jgi:type III pantothenate kinase